MPVFSVANDREPLRSSMEFRITVLNPSIPYSADSLWISTDTSSNNVTRETSILVRYIMWLHDPLRPCE
ncbi:hypothetical protein TNCV_2474481 [Trichonephila clavipes]|nr:hypothetical protein TNCV_2474481 [Trichonephila clavipes]